MQLRYPTTLSGQQYVSQRDWHNATLSGCPNHPGGGCRFHRHGTYSRKTCHGTALVVRYYCRDSGTTFSLLPDCLAARISGTLDECERVVARIEGGASAVAAAQALRGHCIFDETGMSRWAVRRLVRVVACLGAVITMYPELFAGCAVRVVDVRVRLGTDHALRELRGLCVRHLAALPSPVGFHPP